MFSPVHHASLHSNTSTVKSELHNVCNAQWHWCGENIWTSQTEQLDVASISPYLEKSGQLTLLTTCSQYVSEITAIAGNAFRCLAHISANFIKGLHSHICLGKLSKYSFNSLLCNGLISCYVALHKYIARTEVRGVCCYESLLEVLTPNTSPKHPCNTFIWIVSGLIIIHQNTVIPFQT